MRGSGAALHTLVGAYVMDAVPDADRVAFERHLPDCDPCQEEIRGLRETTARLAAAVAIEPRPELRDQTLRAAARVRQLPPVVAEPRPAGLSGRLTRLTRLTRAPRLAAGAGRRYRLMMAAGAVAVVLVAVIVGLSLNVSSMQHRLSASDQRDRAIAAVLGASDARTMNMKVRTGGTATVVMSHRQRELVFTASKLTVLPSNRAYELWLMGPSGDKAAGMLPPPRAGMSGPMVVGGLAPGDRLGLTVEPATGSPQPTTSPVVLVGLGG
jgi:anti-sigma-K factor RskA